jgi:hypothetical protein
MKILIIIALLVSCANADAMERGVRSGSMSNFQILKYTTSALLFIDALQTYEISKSEHAETNLILGENPSAINIAAYFSASILAVNLTPPKYKFLLYGLASAEASFVLSNRLVGIKIGF